MTKHLLIAALLLIALPARAATVEVAPLTPEAAPGESFALSVTLATDENPVNVVEGAVKIPFGVVVDSVSAAGSAFTLWPTYPAYFTTDHAVEFSGGAPGGVPAGTEATLFVIRAHAERPGTYTFSADGTAAYRSDGAGTREAVTATGGTVVVREGAAPVAAPARGASKLVADIGRDASLFDGRYFVAFYGGDRGAGVRYEVREGSGPFRPAERYYVLRDQTLHTPVTVRALDADGVIAETTPNAKPPYGLVAALALILITFLAILFIRGRKIAL